MKKLIVLVLLSGIGIFAWRALRHDSSSNALVFDRFWVDHQIHRDDETFRRFYIRGDRPFGDVGVQTPWRGEWEAFHYHVIPRTDGALELLFPASDHREVVRVSARECSDDGFDYCLEISGSARAAKRYFSRKEWRVGAGGVDEVRDRIVDELAAR